MLHLIVWKHRQIVDEQQFANRADFNDYFKETWEYDWNQGWCFCQLLDENGNSVQL